MEKDADAYRTISEVSETLDIPAHVLRFWETKFPQVKPLKRGGGRRYYRRSDTELLRSIRRLLYDDGYTIRGVQRLLKTRGPGAVAALQPGATQALGDDDNEAAASSEGGEINAVSEVPPRDLTAGLHALLFEIEACRNMLAEAVASDRAEPDRTVSA